MTVKVNHFFRLCEFLREKPGGRFLISKIFGLIVPYSGSVRPKILELDKGVCRIEIQDRRAVRNHLSSIHAVALSNLGEMTSGLSLLSALPDNYQGIVKGFSIEFRKKARGRIEAISKFECPDLSDEVELVVSSDLVDGTGETVATFSAQWKLRKTK